MNDVAEMLGVEPDELVELLLELLLELFDELPQAATNAPNASAMATPRIQ